MRSTLPFVLLVWSCLWYPGCLLGAPGTDVRASVSASRAVDHDGQTRWPLADYGLRVLVMHALSYDTVYGQNLFDLVRLHFPDALVQDFYGTDPALLEEALSQSDILVVPYPTLRMPLAAMFDMGLTMRRFAESGGSILITGTHDVRALRALQLIDVEEAYFSTAPMVHELSSQIDLLEGTPMDFELQNYAYPLMIRNAEYLSLAGLRNPVVYTYCDNGSLDSVCHRHWHGSLSALGVMPLGKGRVYYLGFEYFFDELPATRILTNAIRQIQAAVQVDAPPVAAPVAAEPMQISRTAQHLVAGSGNLRIDMKVFPNPFISSGNLELTLEKPTQVHMEMVDDQGRIVAVLLPQRTLQQGIYRFELPSGIEPGIYFIKCHHDVYVDVRKVVKARVN